MVEHEDVGLRLESEGVVVNLSGGEGDSVGLWDVGPDSSGLNGVGCS